MSLTETMLEAWAKHRAEGKRKGIDKRDEWYSAPDYAYEEAKEWVQQDSAFRLIIGMSLANEAIYEYEKRVENE